jgi:hypothetical protein
MTKEEAKKILTNSISNLHSYRGNLTNQDIDAEVINNVCLIILKKRKQKPSEGENVTELLKTILEQEKNIPVIIKAFTEAAIDLFPDYYGTKNVIAATMGIPNNLAWDGMWNFLADYFRSNHGLEINEKNNSVTKVFSSIKHRRFENNSLISESEVDRIVNIIFDEEDNILVSIAPSLSPKKAFLKSVLGNKKVYEGFDDDYLFILEFDVFDEIEVFTLEMPNRNLKIVYYD